MIGRMKEFFPVVIVSFLFLSTTFGEEPLSLFRDGKSDYRIVLDPDASASELHAVEDLQQYFKVCTGVTLPILRETAVQKTPMIAIGFGGVCRSLGVEPVRASLGEQGYVIRTVGKHLVIAGTREAGTLYGVHRFLEEFLGIRWYAPGVTRRPQIKTLRISPLRRTVRPAFAFRNTSYAWPGRDADFMVRTTLNSSRGDGSGPYGLGYTFDGTCHSYFRYISPNEFFDTHPEYFSQIGGIRRRSETQLCLTNPDVLEIVTRRMLERMHRNPRVRQHNFSQMDYYNFCQCPECRAINERYETVGGTQYWFVNKLAERTSKIFPDKLIGTLAYTYTERPPEGVIMHPNVAVWLCHMFPSCDSHPIESCPKNADYKRRALAWSEKCSHLYIWHYIVNFAHYYTPFPNFRAMAADMRFYRSIGAEGVYLQGMSHGGGGGEFDLLRPYVGMKLLWDPDQNLDALICDFLRGYYGAAWEPVWRYITMLHDKVERENIHMHLYTNPGQGYLPDTVLQDAGKLFDEAESAVHNDPILLKRVQVARMPLLYARLFPRNGYEIRSNKLVFKGDLAGPAEAAAFVEQMRAYGFKALREHYGEPRALIPLSVMLSSGMDVVTIRNKFLAVDVTPLLGGRALRIIHRPTGKCITACNVVKNLYFPFCGGLEDRIDETFNPLGWMEPAAVVDVDQTSIKLSSQPRHGLSLSRTLTLDDSGPTVHVLSTLSNIGKKPCETRLCSHLELNLGRLGKTQIAFINKAGRRVRPDIKKIIDGKRQGLHLFEQNTPRALWRFAGTKGLQVIQSFDNTEVEFTRLCAYPEELGELELELWSRPVLLHPGESISISQKINVRPSDGAIH